MTPTPSPVLPRRRDLRRAGLLGVDPVPAPERAGVASGALPRRRDLRRSGALAAISPAWALDVTELDTVGLDVADLAELDRLDRPGGLDDLTAWNLPAPVEAVPPAFGAPPASEPEQFYGYDGEPGLVDGDQPDGADPFDLASLDLESLDLSSFELDITGFTSGLPVGRGGLDPAFRFGQGDLFVPAEWQHLDLGEQRPGTFGVTAVETTAETVLLPRRRDLRGTQAPRRRPRTLAQLLVALPIGRTARVGLAGGLAAVTLLTVTTQAPKLSHLLDDATAPATASLDIAGHPATGPAGGAQVQAVPNGPALAGASQPLDLDKGQIAHARAVAAQQAAEQAAHAAAVAQAKAAALAQARAKAHAAGVAKARAAAQARAEAQRVAAERAAAAQRAVRNGVRDPRAVGEAMAAQRGWTGVQWTCLDKLWTRESNWNYRAYNPSSGAYGIPQSLPGGKMASAGSDWHTNPATQIKWGLSYIASRYGSPCNAWAHSQAYGWY